MTEVWLDPEPFAVLTELAADPTRAALHRSVEAVLDTLEENPGASTVRQRRFQDPPVWCVLVAAPTERWVVLWEPHPVLAGAVAVRHIGPASFA